MPVSDDARVHDLLIEHVRTYAASAGLEIAYENRGHKLDLPYLQLSTFPVPSQGPTLGTVREIRGNYQIDYVFARGIGREAADEIAGEIADHFEQGLEFFDATGTETIKVKIINQANATGFLYEDQQVRMPINIQYQSFV